MLNSVTYSCEQEQDVRDSKLIDVKRRALLNEELMQVFFLIPAIILRATKLGKLTQIMST
jgi:hypothetical protein